MLSSSPSNVGTLEKVAQKLDAKTRSYAISTPSFVYLPLFHREVNIVGFVGCQFMDFYGRKTDILPSFIRLVSQEVC